MPTNVELYEQLQAALKSDNTMQKYKALFDTIDAYAEFRDNLAEISEAEKIMAGTLLGEQVSAIAKELLTQNPKTDIKELNAMLLERDPLANAYQQHDHLNLAIKKIATVISL